MHHGSFKKPAAILYGLQSHKTDLSLNFADFGSLCFYES